MTNTNNVNYVENLEEVMIDWLNNSEEGKIYSNKMKNGEIFSNSKLIRTMTEDYNWYRFGGDPAQEWETGYGINKETPRNIEDAIFLNNNQEKIINNIKKIKKNHLGDFTLIPLSEDARKEIETLSENEFLISDEYLTNNYIVDKKTNDIREVDRYDVIGSTDYGRMIEYILGSENEAGISILRYVDPYIEEKWNSEEMTKLAKKID